MAAEQQHRDRARAQGAVGVVGHCMNYAWGKTKPTSAVASLMAAESLEDSPDDAHFAELWFGTHPSGPSRLATTPRGVELRAVCEPETLPFLFKILSVGSTLSIQAHPTKSQAAELHARSPASYRDDNHKPEMAVALTPFEALCSFKPVERISELCCAQGPYREVGDAAGQELVEGLRQCSEGEESSEKLRNVVSGLFSCPRERVSQLVQSLCERLRKSACADDEAELVLRLNEQFPGDVGVLCSVMLNHLRLDPGQCLFIRAGEPHAYLSGDCAEIMACSDNVVRAGLTPKEIDAKTLVQILSCSCGAPEVVSPRPSPGGWLLFAAPVPEFALATLYLPPRAESEVPWQERPRIVLALEGTGELRTDDAKFEIRKGTAVFVFPGRRAVVNCTDPNAGMQVIVASTGDPAAATTTS